jgi:hypothetical protein
MTVRQAESGAAAKGTEHDAKAARSGRAKPPRPRPPSAAPPGKTRGRASPPSHLPSPTTGIRLYTPNGGRKYVSAGERAAFLRETERADRQVRTLCMTSAYAGCPRHLRSPRTG